MFSSSPKRRKTSPSTAVPADASNTNTNQRPESRDSRRSPSKRASFQSPTKASIARSHPDVLPGVLSRSPEKTARKRSGSRIGDDDRTNSIKTRSYGLRDRKALRPFLSGPDESPTSRRASTSGENRRRESSTGFVAPPRRISRPSTERSSRQNSTAPERSARLSSPHAANVEDEGVISAQYPGSNAAPNPPDLPDGEFGEPELPPTPTELGLHPRPVRPKGLLSSSPSSRKEKRNMKRGVGFSPSPLKPRPTKPIADEGLREPAGLENNQVLDRAPEVVKTARKLREQLSAQLSRLKNDIAVLENEAQRSERPNDYPIPNRAAVEQLTSVLTTTNPSCAPPPDPPARIPISSVLATFLPFSTRQPSLTQANRARSPSPPPENKFTLDEPSNLAPYLKIFAPLSLDTHTSSSKLLISDDTESVSLKQTHTLTLSAPHPFSAKSYRVPIRLYTDPESQSILSISVLHRRFDPPSQSEPSITPYVPPPLLNWMESRLKNPLLKHDVSGLCWGICRYWEAKVSRARVWATLSSKFRRIILLGGSNSQPRTPDDKRNNTGDEDESLFTSDTSSMAKDTRSLLPHLERTSMVFSSPDGKSRPETRLLVSCSLTLDDWTSEPELHLDICISRSDVTSGSGGYTKIEREAKNLFQSLLTWNEGGEGPDASSIVRAVEGVLGVVFGTDGIMGLGDGKGGRVKDKEKNRATRR